MPAYFFRSEPGAAELRRLARCESGRVCQRVLMIANMLEGMEHEEAARLAGLSRSAAYEWHNRYEEGGIEGLRDRPRPGRQPRVDAVTRARFKERMVAGAVLERFHAGDIDVVTLFFSRFRSLVSQVPTARQLIPAQTEGAAKIDLKGACYEYEPDEETILATLLPRNVTVQIFSAMLENQAGFFAAQMSAMDNATRNAGELIASLTLVMNRTRQAQITKELIEIISGAEAL